MDRHQPAAKTCRQCGSGEYTFRGRKKIEADPAKGHPQSWETKYRCKACGHEWRVRQAVGQER
jgi:DNA-directed RNA polymerase subunit M/transcription elongation factor TFIIS